MLIDTEKIKMLIENNSVSGYAIEAETGISRAQISLYRTGQSSWKNMSLESASKLMPLAEQGKLSYDYEELIEELQYDLHEFGGDLLAVVRGEERYGYRPIVDYYLEEEFDEIDLPCEILWAKDVLQEMKEMNAIM